MPTFPNPKPATLLSLPPETRLAIYPLLFPTLPITLTPSNPIPVPPILQSTTLLRAEALPIFFSTIGLHISVSLRPTPQERPHVLLAKIPETQLRGIRRFVVEWGECFEVVVQLTMNPVKRVEEDDEGVVVGEKWYVVVRSLRASIGEEICETLAETVSKWTGALLEGHKEGLFLDAKDLCWFIANINRHAPAVLQEVCGISA
ncbi:hypothetical protein PRZ48_007449 [Zasmidium cellare]|uniref:Uncharacterized protein n=1 Tax=Zasmidium cellare TaxID=395010 RepID=A0ABR0EK55_ZASCE|nr:hypothetical protein PRZ48_007449 [Zasmidium cellare]